MGLVKKDEHGLWIDIKHKAVRPTGRTHLKEGDETRCHHFGGSTLHGVGKASGRGEYDEVWLSAPESREVYSVRAEEEKGYSGQAVGFEFAMESWLVDLAIFLRASPGFDNLDGPHKTQSLKNARERLKASMGYATGEMKRWAELLAEGKAAMAKAAAEDEAAELTAGASEAFGKKPRPRV